MGDSVGCPGRATQVTHVIRPQLHARPLPVVLAVTIVVAACSPSATVDPSVEPPASGGTAATLQEQPAEAQPTTEAPARPTDGWLAIGLTDVATGETFTLADLAGQVVAIEPMAIWCPNCKAQQDDVKRVYDEIADDGIRYISLGVDPNERAGQLARYAERHGYPWTFARSPVEMSRALSELFGPQILAVPSTPLIVLDENGEIVYQDFGSHGPDALPELFAEVAA